MSLNVKRLEMLARIRERIDSLNAEREKLETLADALENEPEWAEDFIESFEALRRF